MYKNLARFGENKQLIRFVFIAYDCLRAYDWFIFASLHCIMMFSHAVLLYGEFIYYLNQK